MDREQFERLYPELLPGLYRLANGILRHEADAQDAVQTAVLKAWRAADKIKDGGEKAYTARIVINECRNIQRHRMRETAAEIIDNPAFDEAVSTDDEAILRVALDALPPRLRIPLLLRYMEGYSEKECAKILGISVPALKSRAFKAKRELEKALNEEVEFK